MNKKTKSVWLYPICALMFSIYVLTHPLNCSFYTKKALDICFTTLVPSLFPFVFASSFFACVVPQTTGENRILRFFAKLFGVSPSLTPGVILGLFSGFPTGAVFVTKMYERGLCTKNDAIRAVCLSNNCSASFLLNIAGLTVLGSVKYGVMLLICQVLAVISVSQLLKVVFNRKCDNTVLVTRHSHTEQAPSFSKALTDSIKSSSLSMLYISGFVTFFFTLSSILCDTFFPSSDIFRVISGTVFELSTGTLACTNLYFPLNAVLCAFCICFPSLSVLFQIKSICNEHFDVTLQYVFCRICMSFLSAVFVCILLHSGLCAILLLFCLMAGILSLKKIIRLSRVKNAQKKS